MSSPIDLSGAVAMLAWDDIIVSRRSRTYNAQGVMTLGVATSIPMKASVQSLGASAGQSAGGRAGLAGSTGLNVDQTRHGQKTYGAIVLFTTAQLFAADSTSGQQSDEVEHDGILYAVSHVDPWRTSGYWRSVCVKKEV